MAQNFKAENIFLYLTFLNIKFNQSYLSNSNLLGAGRKEGKNMWPSLDLFRRYIIQELWSSSLLTLTFLAHTVFTYKNSLFFSRTAFSLFCDAILHLWKTCKLILEPDQYRGSGQPHHNPLTPKRQNCCRNSSFLQLTLPVSDISISSWSFFPLYSFYTASLSRFQGRLWKNFNKPRPDPTSWIPGSTYHWNASLQLPLEEDDFKTQETFYPSLPLPDWKLHRKSVVPEITLASLCLALCVDKLTDIMGTIFNMLR